LIHTNAKKKIGSTGDNAIALIATCVIHVSVAAGIKWGGWLNVTTAPSATKTKNRLVTLNLTTKPAEFENIFVPVNPETKSITPSEKKTPFYSNANSISANPETTEKLKNTPRIKDGDSLAPGTMHSSVLAPSATTPSLNPLLHSKSNEISTTAKQSTEISPDIIPPDRSAIFKNTQDVVALVDLSQMTSASLPRSNITTSLLPKLPHLPKTPTLSEARKGLGSRSMKQDGGIDQKGPPALDVRLTGFGDYDARFFAAISIAWRNQIRDRSWSPSQVIVDFNLYHDGKIDALVIRETSALPNLQHYCSEAIRRPAPFEPWTKEMKQRLGKGPRHCRISFNYLVK
tara:strand:+ start:2103 stop:3134 length:1032 start_codon:yes stop_codon:yes gene_type:complete